MWKAVTIQYLHLSINQYFYSRSYIDLYQKIEAFKFIKQFQSLIFIDIRMQSARDTWLLLIQIKFK